MTGSGLDPERPWKRETELAVFSLALVMGKPGNRQWLLYAHAPLAEQKAVEITVPEYGPVTVDVTRGGSFYLIDEKTKAAAAVK